MSTYILNCVALCGIITFILFYKDNNAIIPVHVMLVLALRRAIYI